ncbi:MAG: cytochrome c biogenesis protein CcsA [Vicinamibacteria bacterium]|nr:cytochrome c biogenesis protein CcsA [Vicinamibacteria bacterium]
MIPSSLVMMSRTLLILTITFYGCGAILAWHRVFNRLRPKLGWLLWMTGGGFVCHTASLAQRWIEAGHFPGLGLHDVASFSAWMLMLAFLTIYLKARIETLAMGVHPLACGLTFLSSLTPTGAPRDELIVRSLYLPLHTSLVVAAYAALFMAAAMGIMYLIQERELKARTPKISYYLIPSLERCDTMGGLSVLIGFVLLSLAILTGFFWNQAVTGRYWTGDPKVYAALIAWSIYVALLSVRIRSGWGGRRSAWLSVAGFAAVTFIMVWVTILARTPAR